MKAFDKQVGGSHYQWLKIQPLEFSIKNNLCPVKANVLKYVIRHRYKNGVQDLDKALDYLEKGIVLGRYLSARDLVPSSVAVEFIIENEIEKELGEMYVDAIYDLMLAYTVGEYTRVHTIISEIKKREYGV